MYSISLSNADVWSTVLWIYYHVQIFLLEIFKSPLWRKKVPLAFLNLLFLTLTSCNRGPIAAFEFSPQFRLVFSSLSPPLSLSSLFFFSSLLVSSLFPLSFHFLLYLPLSLFSLFFFLSFFPHSIFYLSSFLFHISTLHSGQTCHRSSHRMKVSAPSCTQWTTFDPCFVWNVPIDKLTDR